MSTALVPAARGGPVVPAPQAVAMPGGPAGPVPLAFFSPFSNTSFVPSSTPTHLVQHNGTYFAVQKVDGRVSMPAPPLSLPVPSGFPGQSMPGVHHATHTRTTVTRYYDGQGKTPSQPLAVRTVSEQSSQGAGLPASFAPALPAAAGPRARVWPTDRKFDSAGQPRDSRAALPAAARGAGGGGDAKMELEKKLSPKGSRAKSPSVLDISLPAASLALALRHRLLAVRS